MTRHAQTTIHGTQEPLQAPHAHGTAERLFAAPQTIRGQMVLTPSERHAAERCTPLRHSQDLTAVQR